MVQDDNKDLASAGQESISPAMAAANAIPVRKAATWEQVKALFWYMTRIESAYVWPLSVAAQVILSLYPLILLMLTLTENVFHSPKMTNVVSEMMSNFLPNHQDFVMRQHAAAGGGHREDQDFLRSDVVHHGDWRVPAVGSGAEQCLGSEEGPLLPA